MESFAEYVVGGGADGFQNPVWHSNGLQRFGSGAGNGWNQAARRFIRARAFLLLPLKLQVGFDVAEWQDGQIDEQKILRYFACRGGQDPSALNADYFDRQTLQRANFIGVNVTRRARQSGHDGIVAAALEDTLGQGVRDVRIDGEDSS